MCIYFKRSKGFIMMFLPILISLPTVATEIETLGRASKLILNPLLYVVV